MAYGGLMPIIAAVGVAASSLTCRMTDVGL